MRPLPSYFLHFYVSHPTELVRWHSLVSQAGSVLFKAFTTSYKNFKEKFFKVYYVSLFRRGWPVAVPLVLDEKIHKDQGLATADQPE